MARTFEWLGTLESYTLRKTQLFRGLGPSEGSAYLKVPEGYVIRKARPYREIGPSEVSTLRWARLFGGLGHLGDSDVWKNRYFGGLCPPEFSAFRMVWPAGWFGPSVGSAHRRAQPAGGLGSSEDSTLSRARSSEGSAHRKALPFGGLGPSDGFGPSEGSAIRRARPYVGISPLQDSAFQWVRIFVWLGHSE